MPPLYLLLKPASGLCNLRCRYCFYHDEACSRSQESYGIMQPEILERIIEKALDYAQGACTFAFQGGEPTLAGLEFFQTVVALQKRYNRKNLKIYNAIQTNGVLLNKAWCAFLAKEKFLVGLSLDGIKETHDFCRVYPDGKGSFAQVMQAARMLEKYKVEFNILTVVYAATARHITQIYDAYKKQNFRYLQFIPCLDPLQKPAESFALTPARYADFMKRLFDCWYRDFMAGNYISIRQFDNYIGMLRGYPPECCGFSGVCTLQNVIEADGSVYPCDFYVLDEYRLGNLCVDGFETIEQRGKDSGFIEDSVPVPEACRHCRYAALCRNGCRRHRIEGPASVNRFCEAYRAFFDYSFDRMVSLAQNIR